MKNGSKVEPKMDQKCVRVRVWPALASFGLFWPPLGLPSALLGFPLGLPWGSLGLLWASLSLPWASLGPPLRSLWLSWAPLGPYLGLLWAPCGLIGCLLTSLWLLSASPWPALDQKWSEKVWNNYPSEGPHHYAAFACWM